jgi:hypothetical protein
MGEAVEASVTDGWKAGLKTDLWGELKLCALSDSYLGRHGDPTWNAIELALWLAFADTPWTDFRDCLAHRVWSPLRSRVQHGWESVLRHRIAFLAREADGVWDRAPAQGEIGSQVMPLIDLFHFPPSAREPRKACR